MLLLLLATGSLASGLPLRETSWDVQVTGPLADIVVEQVFHNDSEEWIEATYVFPLDTDAAVDEMTMIIGDRHIIATIKEREAAREEYEAAREAGQTAALTEQERPNVFTQSVANIAPNEDISVRLHIVQPIERIDGGYELVLPLVVGPRFVTAAVEDAARITPPVSRESTGLTVDIDVAIEAGIALGAVESPTHDVDLELDETGAFVLAHGLSATRDFVLRWTPVVDEPRPVVLQQGRHLLVHFEPPEAPPRADIVPRELIWVIDTSCSQSGTPLQMSKKAMEAAFDGMDERDSFWVLNFSDSASSMSPVPLQATPGNIERGREYVRGYSAGGGTNMLDGVELALNLPVDPKRERYVVFLTDGYIGNETEILAAIEDSRGHARVFSFGLGSGVNRYLLDEIGRSGGGTASYVTLDESPEEAVDGFLDTISQPVLSDIEIDWGDWEVDGVYPKRMPDLMAGQPLDLVALAHGGTGPITVRGRLGEGPLEVPLDVQVVGSEDAHAVATTWARQHIGALEREQYWGEIPEIREAITTTSLEYSVLTRYTAFLAVEKRVRNTTGSTRRVDQALDTPDGVDFEASVSRAYTPPGDPLLTLDAPASSRAVIAVFPWGETAMMRWDALRERWYHRFLVPRDVEDGEIEVIVFVLSASGEIERRVEPMWVDSAVSEINTDIEIRDGKTLVTVYAEEPLRSFQVQPLGLPELRERIELAPDEDRWELTLELPGEYCAVEIILKDKAMNTLAEVARCSD